MTRRKHYYVYSERKKGHGVEYVGRLIKGRIVPKRRRK